MKLTYVSASGDKSAPGLSEQMENTHNLCSFKGLNQIEGKIYLLCMIIIFCLLNPLTCRKTWGFEPIHFSSAAGGACPHQRASVQTDRAMQREGQLWGRAVHTQLLCEPGDGELQVHKAPGWE